MRYFIELAYKGTKFSGWQIQTNARSVQQTIEEALKTLFRQNIQVTGAGRTDTGVHASYFVAHVDINQKTQIDTFQVLKSMNALLPDDIALYSLTPVNDEAHARFSAISRTYQYHVISKKDPFKKEFAYRVFKELDITLMNECANELLHVSDFTSFSKLHSQTTTNICKVFEVNWNYNENEYVFTIKADRFLRNMVRAIVGTLMDVGNKKITREEFLGVVKSKDRSNAGGSVPGHGLFLVDIEYEDQIFIKKNTHPH
jgi:tRNA pseudouridine38-40 synthase